MPLRTELRELIEDVKKYTESNDVRQREMIALKSDIERTKAELDELDERYAERQRRVAQLDYLVEQTDAIMASNKTAQELKLTLETDISRLEEAKSIIEETIELRTADLDALIETETLSIEEWEKTIDQKEATVKLLDAKLVDLKSTVEQSAKEEMIVRADLAEQRRLLDIRDKNLRIREAKVEIGEQKLIQNSDLLNM